MNMYDQHYSTPIPPKPPDPPLGLPHGVHFPEIKGEYIEEDCDDIKEESPPHLPETFMPPYHNPTSLSMAPMISIAHHSNPFPRPIHPLPRHPPLYPHPAHLFPNLPPPILVNMNNPHPQLSPLQSLQTLQKLHTQGLGPSKRKSQMELEKPKKHKVERILNTQAKSPKLNTHNLPHQELPSPSSSSCSSISDEGMLHAKPKSPKDTMSKSSKKSPSKKSPSPDQEKSEKYGDTGDGSSEKATIDCPVCGDLAIAHFHYGGMCCYSCKAFFRRVVNTSKAAKYKCRSGSNRCDVSLANRRSCQACRYKKCVAAGMKPGLVLSDEQCQKRFGPRKGVKDDRFAEPASKFRFGSSNDIDEMGEEVDDPDAALERELHDENEFSVLIDSEKSYEEQNKIGRQLFISLYDTGSVSSEKISDEEMKTFDSLDDNIAMMLSAQIERQISNARKFVSFNQDDGTKKRILFQPNGQINTYDVLQTVVDQTILVAKHNQDFNSLSLADQTELLESNVMVAGLLTTFQLYSTQTHTVTWKLTEPDFRCLRTLDIAASNGRASFGLSDVLPRVEPEIKDDLMKLFKFFDFFSHISIPVPALQILTLVVLFTHDCCDLKDQPKVESKRRRYLFLLFESLCNTEGVLGACNVASRLHGALNDLNRICQLLGQKFVNVKE